MGDRVICPTTKTMVEQGGAVERKNGLAPLLHHPAPKGAVEVVEQLGAPSPFTARWSAPIRSQCPAFLGGGASGGGVALSRCVRGGRP